MSPARRNRGVDIASSGWLNSLMRVRSGFLAACGFVALACALRGQGGVAPSFTTQPAGVQALAGEAVTLTAAADGTAPITFQWRKGGVALAGATGASLFLPGVLLGDAGLYDVVAANPFGSATSLAAALGVTLRRQAIAFSPPAAAAAGARLTLDATAGSALPVTYTLISGNATLSGNVLTGVSGNVIVRAQQAGNAVYAAADAVDRTLTFVAGALSPFITSPPPDQTVDAGASATFRASAIGTPAPAYQWQKDGVALAGATGSALTIPNLTLADSGRYSVTVTNLAGTASASATLTVRAAPVFTTAPESQTVFAGAPVLFNAAATGVPAPTFQWRKNGAAIAGATSATLRIAAAVAADAGRYEVVATNALGALASAAATLAVTTRDFTGTYFGRILEPNGDFPAEVALLVRRDRPAVFLARLPGAGTAVAAEVSVDLAGNFGGDSTTMGTPLASPITVRGTLDESAGTLAGALATGSARWTFAGTRAAATGAAGSRAGFYAGAHLGTATGRCFALVAPDGDTLIVYAANIGVISAHAPLDAAGRLVAPRPDAAVFDVTFNAGLMSGEIRPVAPSPGLLAGALDTLLGTERLVNLSVRSPTLDAAPLIAGFVIAGAASKQVLVRAAGPAIAVTPFSVGGALPDPFLQVLRGNSVVAQNDDWNTPAANGATVTAAATRVGAFPFRAGSNDAALVTTLQPGAYTARITGGTGNALAEIYEVLDATEAPGARRLVNLSARGLVSPGNPLIVGFVVAGAAPQRVLLRGIGPTLGQPPFNVPGALPNPQLTLFRGTTIVKTNDDWFRDTDAPLIRDAAARAGAFTLGAQSADAALLLHLAPGAYTAQLSGPANAGANTGTGLALVEVYEASP